MTSAEPMVVTDPETIPPLGRKFWMDDNMFSLDREGLPLPRFSVQTCAQVFFGKGADWLRWRMRPDPGHGFPEGYFVLEGKRIVPRRTPSGSRYFTLADVERMGHALAEGGVIDGGQLINVIVMVKTCGKVYRVTA